MPTPNDIFLGLLRNKRTVLNNWKGKPFAKIKRIATTEKGDLGEDFFAKLLRNFGYSDVEVKDGRRGHYDIAVSQKVFFEVKVATQDTEKSFQFNGIRLDREFSHLLCLGITPDSLFYLIVGREKLPSREYPLASMAKGTNSTFKLTRKTSQMQTFDTFEVDIKQCFL